MSVQIWALVQDQRIKAVQGHSSKMINVEADPLKISSRQRGLEANWAPSFNEVEFVPDLRKRQSCAYLPYDRKTQDIIWFTSAYEGIRRQIEDDQQRTMPAIVPTEFVDLIRRRSTARASISLAAGAHGMDSAHLESPSSRHRWSFTISVRAYRSWESMPCISPTTKTCQISATASISKRALSMANGRTGRSWSRGESRLASAFPRCHIRVEPRSDSASLAPDRHRHLATNTGQLTSFASLQVRGATIVPSIKAERSRCR